MSRPGFRCSACGRLNLTADPCVECGGKMVEVPDLYEEAVHDAIEQSAHVRYWKDPALARPIPWRPTGGTEMARGRMRTTRRPLFGDADPNGELHPDPSRGIQDSREFLLAERRSRGILQ